MQLDTYAAAIVDSFCTSANRIGQSSVHIWIRHCKHRHLYVLDKRLQPTAMLYLVGLLSGAQVEYKPVDLQSYEARNVASLVQSFKYNFSFPSMYRRLKSTRLIQCYERKQIWSETGSQMASEIPSKLTCVLTAPWSHRRLNWTAMLCVQSNINVYDCKRALTWSTIL